MNQKSNSGNAWQLVSPEQMKKQLRLKCCMWLQNRHQNVVSIVFLCAPALSAKDKVRMRVQQSGF
jgi:hypothetical protein